MLRKLLIVACLSSLVFIAFGQKKKNGKNIAVAGAAEQLVNYKEIRAPLPPLRIFTKQGKYLTEKDLSNDAHLILMIFNPTCDHCEEQTFILKKNIFMFDKSNLVLIAAPSMIPHLGYFTNNTKIDGYPTFKVGVDSSDYIDKTFRQITLPQINIYDRERKLVKMFYGITPIDSLKQYIN